MTWTVGEFKFEWAQHNRVFKMFTNNDTLPLKEVHLTHCDTEPLVKRFAIAIMRDWLYGQLFAATQAEKQL